MILDLFSENITYRNTAVNTSHNTSQLTSYSTTYATQHSTQRATSKTTGITTTYQRAYCNNPTIGQAMSNAEVTTIAGGSPFAASKQFTVRLYAWPTEPTRYEDRLITDSSGALYGCVGSNSDSRDWAYIRAGSTNTDKFNRFKAETIAMGNNKWLNPKFPTYYQTETGYVSTFNTSYNTYYTTTYNTIGNVSRNTSYQTAYNTDYQTFI